MFALVIQYNTMYNPTHIYSTDTWNSAFQLWWDLIGKEWCPTNKYGEGTPMFIINGIIGYQFIHVGQGNIETKISGGRPIVDGRYPIYSNNDWTLLDHEVLTKEYNLAVKETLKALRI